MSLLTTFTDPRDGTIYRVAQIGKQSWLAENLKYLPRVAPTATRLSLRFWKKNANLSVTQPYYYVYGYQVWSVTQAKSIANYQNYGVLYNWPAAVQACPPGWHLPTDAEWDQLINFMMTEHRLYNDWVHTDGVGNALKSRLQIDTPLGNAFNTNEHPRWESHHTPPPERKTISVDVGAHYGNDTVGFSALPSGRFAYDAFTELGFHGFWWSASEYYETRAWYRMMRHEFGDVTRSTFDKAAGMSVRCVQDY